MRLFGNLFGFRWSLYLVRNGNELVYAMHENSPIRIVGYVMGYFANGGLPVEPWSLHLNFNKKHQTIKLGPEHFTPDGQNLTALLKTQIKTIDPNWLIKDGEPVFEEAATKKKIKMNDFKERLDLQAILDDVEKPRETTFYTVMNEIFARSGKHIWSIETEW